MVSLHLQSGVILPVVHSHVLAGFLKTLVDTRTDMSWFQHRSELVSGEAKNLKSQLLPTGAAAKGFTRVSGLSGLEGEDILRRLLFSSPPTTKEGAQNMLRNVFKDTRLPVRYWLHAYRQSCMPSDAFFPDIRN